MKKKLSLYLGLLGSVSIFALLIGCGGSGSGYSAKKVGSTTTGTTPPYGAGVFGINDSGIGVGVLSYTTSGYGIALLWNTGSGTVPARYSVKDLGGLGGNVPGITSAVTAINASGQAVGYSYNSFNESTPFFYDGATMHDLGFPGTDDDGQAASLNDAGEVVGDSDMGGSGVHGWKYVPGSGFTILQPAVTALAYYGIAISNSNVAYGYGNAQLNKNPTAYQEDASNVTTNLGPGQVSAVNNNGYVVGQMNPGPFYSVSGTEHNLPCVTPAQCYVFCINNNNLMAGWDFYGGTLHPVTWTTAGVKTELGFLGSKNVYDLNTLISPADQTTYGHLTIAQAINAAGQIAVNTANGHALILTPAP